MFRKISKNVYWLGLLSFFNDVTADMITPLLPVYLGTMGLGASFLGVMEGFAEALSNITKLFSGWLCDRYGNAKKLTVTGYSLSTGIRLLIAIPIPLVVLSARLMDRLGKGIRTSPRDQLITASVDKKYWGEAFGIQRSMDHAGAILGPLIATWLLSAFKISYSQLFLIACIPSLLSILFIPSQIKKVPTQPIDRSSRISWKLLPMSMKRYIVIIFLAALCTPSELFILMRMKEWGLSAIHLPIAWLLMTVSTFFAAYLGGLLADHWSRRRTIGLGWAIFGLSYLGFAFNESLIMGWLLLMVYGFQIGLVEPAERSYPARVVPNTMRATALGWFYLAYGLGLLPASIIFGLLWDHVGSQFAFLLNAGLTFLTILLLTILPSDRKPVLTIPQEVGGFEEGE